MARSSRRSRAAGKSQLAPGRSVRGEAEVCIQLCGGGSGRLGEERPCLHTVTCKSSPSPGDRSSLRFEVTSCLLHLARQTGAWPPGAGKRNRRGSSSSRGSRSEGVGRCTAVKIFAPSMPGWSRKPNTCLQKTNCSVKRLSQSLGGTGRRR